MRIGPLRTIEQARALSQCFYDTYGLTFHRRYVYDPEALLELNRSGVFTSFVAEEHGRVIGHLAVFEPFFDLSDEEGPVCDGAVREVGLSLVRPDARNRGVQAALGMAMHRWARERGFAGGFMKCVTRHVFSQRSAYAYGGSPVALLLGGVARWMVYEGEEAEAGEPISFLVYYVPVRRMDARPLALGARQAWLWEYVQAARVPRTELVGGRPEERPTRLVVTWNGDRRVGTIHVTRAGPDLLERLAERLDWLVGGFIEHVTVFLPADEPRVAALDRELEEELGLFLGGWVPGLLRGGRDALIYQLLDRDSLSLELIRTHGALGRALRDRVYHAWLRTPGLARAA